MQTDYLICIFDDSEQKTKNGIGEESVIVKELQEMDK